MNATAKRWILPGAGVLAILLLTPFPLRAQDKKDAPTAVETKPEAKPEAKPEVKPVAESTKASGNTKAELVGATTCLGCHTDKDSFRKNIHAKAMPREKGVEFEQSCETCHGPGSLHVAAGGDKSNPDFYTIHNPKRMKASEASKTCLQCHEGGARMNWEGSKHDSKNVSCVNCHSVHNEEANGGQAPLLTKKSQAEVCYQCHAEKKAQIQKSAHMPLVEGKMGCTACHNPHGSNTEKLLVKDSVTETCYQCHQDKRGPYLWEHPPVREDCRNCHEAHGSTNDYMLIIKPPFLCSRCHLSGSHMGGEQNDANMINIQSVYGGEGHSCVNCHSRIHGSNHPSGKRFFR